MLCLLGQRCKNRMSGRNRSMPAAHLTKKYATLRQMPQNKIIISLYQKKCQFGQGSLPDDIGSYCLQNRVPLLKYRLSTGGG